MSGAASTAAFEDLKTYVQTLSPEEAIAFLQCLLTNTSEELFSIAGGLPLQQSFPIMRDAWVCTLAVDVLGRVIAPKADLVPDHHECSAALKFAADKFLGTIRELRARRAGS